MIDTHSPAWPVLKSRALRSEVRRLRGMSSCELPALTYADGWWWRDFVLEALPAGPLQDCDATLFLRLLTTHALARSRAGLWRSPELVATIYRLLYPADALRMFAGEAMGRGEMPDQHTLWLLLHPERLPEDFKMYVRRACS